ncbi:MAG: DUF4442 domain-containing protein [Sterolibacterium sp.]|nr:DUF4442 domain-containing protein [Sterolibacterium sp.]
MQNLPENPILAYWRRLSAIPGGRSIFSKAVQYKAPYFRSINARIEELQPGHARLRLRKRRALENHIGTVHAIAICNLLEMAMGVMAEVSIPDHLRWIPKGMSVDYIGKAGSDIIGIAETAAAVWQPGDLDVRVLARCATTDKPLVSGTITLWISEKRRP